MKPKTILLKATVENLSSRKDNTLKITIGTQQLKEGAELFALQNELVSIGISRLNITQEDVELIAENKFGVDDVPNKKSQSQRLRGVLFLLGSQRGETDSDSFYKRTMENIIEFYKAKLEQ
tara:strand:- start:313 stop:675 length:363 start_codon:yes stop_codon:yes gene_type:complete